MENSLIEDYKREEMARSPEEKLIILLIMG